MDDPVPIEGIIDGEPESLAVVCAAGGSAIVAYCSALGAEVHVADTVVAALATFRRGVVENADQEPAQLEALLVTSTAHAARRVAGVDPSPVQQAAAQVALEGAVTGPLTPGLAPRVIRALVEAAPVTALGGDAAAVRRATEQHYIRMFDRYPVPLPAPASPAATAHAPGSASPPPSSWTPAPPPDAPRPAAADGAWIPPELAGLDADVANARAVSPAPQWNLPLPPPAEAPPEPQPPAPAPGAAPADAPTVPPPPGALVIKRGGHWPFRQRRRSLSHARGGPGRIRNVLIAGAVGLAAGVAAALVAAPERSIKRDTILVRPLDIPFTVDGAVFNIVRTRGAFRSLQIRRRVPRPGRVWLTLAAQTRNISRPDYRPRGLGYRLRTTAGIVIGPDTARVPPEISARQGRLPVKQRSSVHLGFQVPLDEGDLTLEFDAGRGAPTIRVPLN